MCVTFLVCARQAMDPSSSRRTSPWLSRRSWEELAGTGREALGDQIRGGAPPRLEKVTDRRNEEAIVEGKQPKTKRPEERNIVVVAFLGLGWHLGSGKLALAGGEVVVARRRLTATTRRKTGRATAIGEVRNLLRICKPRQTATPETLYCPSPRGTRCPFHPNDVSLSLFDL